MAEVIRLGYLDFLNTLPVYKGIEGLARLDQEPPFEFRFRGECGSPVRLNGMLAAGDIDIAPASSVEYVRGRGRYRFAPGVCVSSRGAVGSVILFSRVPIRDLDGRLVVLPGNSATSVALLKVIARRLWGVCPEYRTWTGAPDLAGMLSMGDAALLIGDEALRCSFAFTGLQQIDLGQAWYDLTGLPMVFSVWLYRAGWALTQPEAAKWAGARLRVSLREGLKIMPGLLPSLAEERQIPVETLKRYFADNLSFSLGQEELKGLRLFGELVRQQETGSGRGYCCREPWQAKRGL